MEIKVNTNGVTQLIVKDNCEFSDFYSFAELLAKTLAIQYLNQVNDFDSLYWIFNYAHSSLILSYNTYLGISIYPQKGNQASNEEIEALHSIKVILNS